jgi:hypothetical protein
VINRYHKSLVKSQKKSGTQIPGKSGLTSFDALVLDKRFPLEKKRKLEVEPKASKQLNIIKIDAEEGNLHIKDSVLWNLLDQDKHLFHQFAVSVVKDYIEERHLDPTPVQIMSITKLILNNPKGLIKKVEDQIKEQVEALNKVQDFTEALVTLNANSSSFKQKECLISISLHIIEGELEFRDRFDWELDNKLNE